MKVRIAVICLLIGVMGPAMAVEDWNGRMRQIASALSDLLPYAMNNEKFNNPSLAPEIKKRIDRLAALGKELQSSTFKHGKMDKSADPIIPFMAASLGNDFERASVVYEVGDRKYAQQLLQNSLSYCTSCHTRSEPKSGFKLPIFGENAADMTLTQRIKLLAATRQFEEALKEFERADLPSLNPFELESAATLAIAIAVRVKEDPTKALEMVERVQKFKGATPSFKEELAAWRNGLKVWKIESITPTKGEDEKFAQARALIDRGEASRQTPLNRSAEIDFLRASARLHDFLQANPQTPLAAQAFLLLGRAYESMQELGFWSLHEVYYEACIRKSPHSLLAQDCFRRYDESVLLGYSGSSGIHIPMEIGFKLKELKGLASFKRQNKSNNKEKVELR